MSKGKVGFDVAWSAVCSPRHGENVSGELRPLLEDVYASIAAKPFDLVAVKESLEELLAFLSTNGRTNANCWATDLFFGLDHGWETHWSEKGLREDLHDILADMGSALHDTVKDPAIAANFECLPEQLLEKVRKLPV